VDKIPSGSLGFVTGFNQIFRKNIIDKFISLLNFHPSILPCYRGAIPSYWVIKNKEKTTGFTVHVISENIDVGQILYQETVEVNRDISEDELDSKISQVGSYYLRECLNAIQEGKSLRKKIIVPQYLQKVDYVSPRRQ
jgi:methionyl-tRNA formyltransferase